MTGPDVVEHICSALRDGHSAAALDLLLEETAARAVGLWRVEGGRLLQVSFRAVAEMPDDAKTEFASATRSVPLEETSLGIVKAVVSGEPAVATVSGTAGLGGSASWLVRFGARQSLAAPVFSRGRVIGVVAISTARELVPKCAEWRLVIELARGLGDLLTPAGPAPSLRTPGN